MRMSRSIETMTLALKGRMRRSKVPEWLLKTIWLKLRIRIVSNLSLPFAKWELRPRLSRLLVLQ